MKYSLSAETFLWKWSCREDGNVFGLSESGAFSGSRGRKRAWWNSTSICIPGPALSDWSLSFHAENRWQPDTGEGSVPCAPWGFCIQLSKKSSKSKEVNEAADCSQLCRTCLTYTMLIYFLQILNDNSIYFPRQHCHHLRGICIGVVFFTVEYT